MNSNSHGRGVIGYFNYGEKKAVILTTTCGIVRRDYTRVIPRPDLPRMTWPGTGQKAVPAPALPDGWRLADHKDHGRVLVVRTDGENVIFGAPFKATGIRTHVGLVSDLTFVDTDTVPTNTLAVGSMWINSGALARACEESGRDQIVVLDHAGNAYVWDEMAEWWEGSAPPRFAPYTILHAGKKADQ